jgi:hypothetical protein
MIPYTAGAILIASLSLLFVFIAGTWRIIQRRRAEERENNLLRYQYLMAIHHAFDRQPDRDPDVRAKYAQRRRRVN